MQQPEQQGGGVMQQSVGGGTSALPGPRRTLPYMVRYLRDPIAFYADARRRWGDPFMLNSFNGRLVVTGRADLIREIFAADPASFDAWGADAVAPFVGPTSVLLASGARHRRQRKLLMPPFHGARMRAYGEAMMQAARREVAGWPRQGVFRLLPAMQRISLAVIVETVFGIRDAARQAEWSSAIVATMDAVHPAMLFIPSLQREFGGIGPWARFRRAMARLDAMIAAEITARRTRDADGDDVLRLLLGATDEDGLAMPDDEVRDQLVTLLIAGHETTALALSWALYELARDPALRARVRDELGDATAPEVITRLPLLDAVCQETLRRHPVVADIARTPLHPMTLDGYPVPSGAAVMPAIAAAHFDPAVFPDPAAFRPERFLERHFTPYEFFPFGGGARRCIGAAFALYEMKLALAAVVRAGTLTLRDPGPVSIQHRGLTLGPRGELPVRFAASS